MEDWENFESEYNDLASDVANANYTTYEQKLGDFIAFIEQSRWSSQSVAQLITGFDFTAWYADCGETTGSMVGSGELNWAKDRTARLGQQFALFKHFADKEGAFADFSINFMYTGSKYDGMIHEINRQLFGPFSRDLLKHLRRTSPLETKSIPIPASDRVVELDHNAPAYAKLNANLDQLEAAAQQSNELAVHQTAERDRVVAELGAARRLLRAARARVDALVTLLIPALTWLGTQIRDTIVQNSITVAIAALAALLGIALPGL